jgi:hypothetical protein
MTRVMGAVLQVTVIWPECVKYILPMIMLFSVDVVCPITPKVSQASHSASCIGGYVSSCKMCSVFRDTSIFNKMHSLVKKPSQYPTQPNTIADLLCRVLSRHWCCATWPDVQPTHILTRDSASAITPHLVAHATHCA